MNIFVLLIVFAFTLDASLAYVASGATSFIFSSKVDDYWVSAEIKLENGMLGPLQGPIVCPKGQKPSMLGKLFKRSKKKNCVYRDYCTEGKRKLKRLFKKKKTPLNQCQIVGFSDNSKSKYLIEVTPRTPFLKAGEGWQGPNNNIWSVGERYRVSIVQSGAAGVPGAVAPMMPMPTAVGMNAGMAIGAGAAMGMGGIPASMAVLSGNTGLPGQMMPMSTRIKRLPSMLQSPYGMGYGYDAKFGSKKRYRKKQRPIGGPFSPPILGYETQLIRQPYAITFLVIANGVKMTAYGQITRDEPIIIRGPAICRSSSSSFCFTVERSLLQPSRGSCYKIQFMGIKKSRSKPTFELCSVVPYVRIFNSKVRVKKNEIRITKISQARLDFSPASNPYQHLNDVSYSVSQMSDMLTNSLSPDSVPIWSLPLSVTDISKFSTSGDKVKSSKKKRRSKSSKRKKKSRKRNRKG